MAHSRERRPSARPERRPRTPCHRRPTLGHGCPSRAHVDGAGTRAADLDDRGAPRRCSGAVHWHGDAPRGSPPRGTHHRSRSASSRGGGIDERPSGTAHNSPVEGPPAATNARSKANVVTNLAPPDHLGEHSDQRRSPLSTGGLGDQTGPSAFCTCTLRFTNPYTRQSRGPTSGPNPRRHRQEAADLSCRLQGPVAIVRDVMAPLHDAANAT